MNIKIRIGNRIREERNAKGLTRKALAALTDDLNISRLNNYERGERTPGPEEIKQLAKALEVAPAYLMCLTDDKHPKKIPGIGALLPLLDHKQACDAVTQIQAMRSEQRDGEATFIPISVEVAMDLGKNAFALKMTDDSMHPDFQVNDILIIDPDRKPNPGNFVVARLEDDNEVIVRRYRQLSAVKKEHVIELLATNDAWANSRIENDNNSKMIGSVITLIRKLKL